MPPLEESQDFRQSFHGLGRKCHQLFFLSLTWKEEQAWGNDLSYRSFEYESLWLGQNKNLWVCARSVGKAWIEELHLHGSEGSPRYSNEADAEDQALSESALWELCVIFLCFLFYIQVGDTSKNLEDKSRQEQMLGSAIVCLDLHHKKSSFCCCSWQGLVKWGSFMRAHHRNWRTK